VEDAAVARKYTYEKQAKLSVVLGAIGAIGTLGAMACILQAFDWSNFWIAYNPHGRRILAIGGGLFVGFVAGAIGFLVGFNSAGQRMNTKNRLAWTGFFLSAAAVTLALCSGVFFYLTRYPIPLKRGG